MREPLKRDPYLQLILDHDSEVAEKVVWSQRSSGDPARRYDFEDLRKELADLPADWYRPLFEVMVEASYKKGSWSPDGCSFFVVNLEDAANMKAIADIPDCTVCEGTGFISVQRGRKKIESLCQICGGTGKQQIKKEKESVETEIRLRGSSARDDSKLPEIRVRSIGAGSTLRHGSRPSLSTARPHL